jgi:hypothetical protein
MSNEIEIWKSLPWRNWIEVSNFGNIRSTNFNRSGKIKLLSQSLHWCGYKRISFNNKAYYSHRLVAELFIPNPENKTQVNHIDCNKANNRVENLEWVNQSENMLHARANGLRPITENQRKGLSLGWRAGVKHHNSKITINQIAEIRRLHNSGFKGRHIAQKMNVSAATIYGLVNGKTYKNVTTS